MIKKIYDIHAFFEYFKEWNDTIEVIFYTGKDLERKSSCIKKADQIPNHKRFIMDGRDFQRSENQIYEIE